MINSTEKEIMESFETLLPHLPMLFEEDISCGVTDTEKYLKVVLSDKLPLKIKNGDIIPPDGAVKEALDTGRVIIKDVSKSVYGTAFKSYAIPIFNNNNVVGVIVIGKSLEKRNDVIQMTQNLTLSIEQMSLAIQNITNEVQSIVNDSNNIISEVNIATTNVEGSNEILNIIKGVSKQTNLLGLNAAIESARAGELGRGFSVVAGEIRKLSSSSAESVGNIESILTNIKKSINNISDKISSTNASVENGAASLEEITSSIEELTRSAQYLEEFAKNNL